MYTFWICAGRPVLKLAELDSLLRSFLLEDYHRRKHSETDATPLERWEEGGFLPRMPESLEQLDLLLLTVPKTRVVHQDGIRFQGLRFVDPTLAAYVGESVILRYDPRDVAEIRVFHNQRFLCRAICPELAGETVSLRALRELISLHTVLYTPGVINTPRQIDHDLATWRDHLKSLALESLRREEALRGSQPFTYDIFETEGGSDIMNRNIGSERERGQSTILDRRP